MSTRDLLITAVAIVVLLATMGAVWGIHGYKAEQRLAAQEADLVGTHYETAVNPDQYRIETVKAPERKQPPTELPDSPNRSTARSTGSGPPRSSATTSAGQGTQSPDFDGDGIPDAADRCPTRPETVNGFQDGDGCPDVVETSTGAS